MFINDFDSITSKYVTNIIVVDINRTIKKIVKMCKEPQLLFLVMEKSEIIRNDLESMN